MTNYKVQYPESNNFYCIVRPGNVYGRYDNFDPSTGMVIPSLISRIHKGEDPLKVWGDGKAIRDFIYPDRVVVGSNEEKSKKILKNLYSPLISKGAKYVSTNRRAAELIKYASNAFLATKITFINEIANLCEKTGINVEDISLGIGSDNRIGSRFLRAGPAYGGSCFPKDTKGLVSIADKFKTCLLYTSDAADE